MKKFAKNIFTGLALLAVIGASIGGIRLIDDSSEVVDTIPVFNIANHPDHPFYAINEEVVLTVTVLPADASDKTVEWSTSDDAKVSITALTDTTAKMKCLAAFTGEVTITATATNGTVTTDDDFSATCVATYVVPVTSIELVWEGSTSIDPATHVFEVGDILYFDVVVLPANATTHSWEAQIDWTYLDNAINEPYSVIQLEVIAETPIGVLTDLVVVSDFDNAITDTVSMQFGAELDLAAFWTEATIEKSTDGGTTWSSNGLGVDLGAYYDAYYEYENIKFNTGDLIRLNFGPLDFKFSTVRVITDPLYLEFDTILNALYTNFDGTSVDLDPFFGVSDTYVVFEVIAPIPFSADFTIEVIFINYTHADILIPFTLFRPVSGISVDTGTYVF